MKRIFLSCVLLLSACTSEQTKQEVPYEGLPKAEDRTADVAKVVRTRSGEVKTAAVEIQKASTQNEVVRKGILIEVNAKILEEQATRLDELQSLFDGAKKENVELKKTIDAKDEEIREKDSAGRKLLNVILSLVAAISVLGLAFSAWQFATGSPGAMATGIAAAVAGGVSITYMSQWDNIGLLGLGLLAIALVFFGVQMVMGGIDLYKKHKANLETVQLVEAIRPKLPQASEEAIFGKQPVTGEVAKIQSPSTVKLVKHIRDGMKRQAEKAQHFIKK